MVRRDGSNRMLLIFCVSGFVENMGAFVCTHCGETSHLFGDFARDWAKDKAVPFLGSVPLEKEIMVRNKKFKVTVSAAY